LGFGRVIGVEEVIPPGDEGPLPAIGDAPVHEECAFVEEVGWKLPVLDAEVAVFVTAEAVLGLPAGQIGIDQDIALGDEAGAYADYQDQAAPEGGEPAAQVGNFLLVEELGQDQPREKTEHGVIAPKKRGREFVCAARRQQGLSRFQGQNGSQPSLELAQYVVLVHSRVTFDDQNCPVGVSAGDLPTQAFGTSIPPDGAGLGGVGHGQHGELVVVALQESSYSFSLLRSVWVDRMVKSALPQRTCRS